MVDVMVDVELLSVEVDVVVVIEVDVVAEAEAVAVELVVDELQDAKTSDINIRPVSITQIIPLFICISFFTKLGTLTATHSLIFDII